MKKILPYLKLIFFFSCETVVEIEQPDFEPSMVVNGLFNPDSVMRVYLYESQNILDDALFKRIHNAEVLLYEDGQLLGTMTEGYAAVDSALDGVYAYPRRPTVGATYQLNIKHADFPQVTATTRIPSTLPELAIDTLIERFDQLGFRNREVKINIRDTVPGTNYYEVQVYALAFDVVVLGDTVADLNSLVRPIIFETNDVIFEDFSDLSRRKVFTDELFDQSEYSFEVSFTYGNEYSFEEELGIELPEEFYIRVKSVSEDYYQYYATADLQRDLSSNPFAEPVQVHNNIINGFGIFASYWLTEIEVR
jgi:hypothetical protein